MVSKPYYVELNDTRFDNQVIMYHLKYFEDINVDALIYRPFKNS